MAERTTCAWMQHEIDRRYHEAANLFPLLDGPDFEELVADIKANGLLHPIWLHRDGSILDGRNRHRACIEAMVEPQFRTYEGESPTSFVTSMNLHRRHLSSSQRAVIALDVLPMLEAEASRRQQATRFGGNAIICGTEQDSGEARDHAARMLQTNRQYVSDAKKLQTEAPDLLDQVRAGNMTIPQAKRELEARAMPEPLARWKLAHDVTMEMVWQELRTLDYALSAAQTLPEVLKVRDAAFSLENALAEYNLRLGRRVGELLDLLKADGHG